MVDQPRGRIACRWQILLPVLLVGACGDASRPDKPRTEPTFAPAAETSPAPSPTPMPTPTPTGRDDRSTYTSLRNCRLMASQPDEAGYSLSRCAGIGGYDLEVSESDGRQSLALVSAAGTRQLNLPGVVGSGFSTLGERVEWRARATGGRPAALIARYAVAEAPETPGLDTSYLVVVDLAQGCVIGKVRPGGDQNDAAQRIGDTGGRCLPAPG